MFCESKWKDCFPRLVAALVCLFCPMAVMGEGVTRDLSGYSGAGVGFTVSLAVDPPAGTGLVLVEDIPPSGWGVSNVTESGSWDSQQGKVKWGPFFGPPFPAVLSYDVLPPPDAFGQNCFDGTASFDVAGTAPIIGDQCVGVPIPLASGSALAVFALLLLATGGFVIRSRRGIRIRT